MFSNTKNVLVTGFVVLLLIGGVHALKDMSKGMQDYKAQQEAKMMAALK